MLLKPTLQYIFLLALSVFLTATTFVFGALPMRVVRRVYGRLAFWAGFVAIAAGIFAAHAPLYALMVLALAVLTGVSEEVEEHGGSVFMAGFAGVLSTLGIVAFGGALWLHQSKLHLLEELRKGVTELIDRMTEVNPNAVVNADAVLQQLPSVVVISLICALAIAMIGEARLLRWFNPKMSERAFLDRSRLVSFRVPDVFIWLSIVSIFGAFFRHGQAWAEIASVNALNVLVFMFFFQGLAIASHAFRVFKVSNFWRSLWYVVLVLQLFLIVSLVGFTDFWLEFRQRLTRKPAATNKSF